MIINIFVDGSGGNDSGYGFYIENTGESFYEKKSNLTNNQAEYMAIIQALKRIIDIEKEIIIYSDSKVVVSQLNHQYAINNDTLRLLARDTWSLIKRHKSVKIIWISREQNLAGKMLGS
ncbi:MAG: reverse transcriptase-like protein [Thaumarchaeota archaeon]|nr:reverse transcriptase-like protein [Nitrososphaerota archaeon]MCY3976440.1 reverse transcriptase-like protein [Nitrososphaerota archaeon]